MPDVQPPESSPGLTAVEPAAEVTLKPLDQFTPAEREHWQLTGERPEDRKPSGESQPPTAESAPAAPDDQAASTDAQRPPDSEPGKPAKKKNADSRVRELLDERYRERQQWERERAELVQRLERLENGGRAPAPDGPAVSSPAPDPDRFPSYDEWVQQPGNAARSYEDYSDARADHRWEARERARQEQAEIHGKLTGFSQRMTEAAKADPSLYDSISPELYHLKPLEQLGPREAPTLANVLASEIVASEHAPAVLKYLSEHPDVYAGLVSSRDAATLIRAFGRLEARLEPSSKPVLPQSVISRAPDPPATLGTRPAGPTDPVEGALARGDFEAYRREQNAREIAGR